MDNLNESEYIILAGILVNVLAGTVSLGATYGLSILLVDWGYIAPSELGESPMQRAKGRARQILGFQLIGSIIAFVAGFVLFLITLPLTFFLVGGVLILLLPSDLVGRSLGAAHELVSLAFLLFLCAMLTHLPTQLIAYWFAYRHAAWLR